MQWHEFVFSNQSRRRMRRHLAFWLLWLLFIVFTIFFTQKISGPFFYHYQPGLNELGYLQYSLLVLLKSVLLLLTHLFFCYTIIYFLLPGYLSKRKYGHLLTGVLLLCALIIPIGYFLYSLVYPHIDNLFNLHITEANKNILWASISAGLIGSIKVTLVAVAITLLKRWWLKQKEKEQLEREKVNAELQLLKAQIHPAFLFSTLNDIISQAQAASPRAPEMLIKLSNLLSYMLYECDEPKVKLEKEISMVKEYMELEKTSMGDKLEMSISVKGDADNKMIAPLLLLPFIENSFSYCSYLKLEKTWINLDLRIEGNDLSMKLVNGKSADEEIVTSPHENGLGNVHKRLDLLYPRKNEIRIHAGPEVMMTFLKIRLDEEKCDTDHNDVVEKQTTAGEPN